MPKALDRYPGRWAFVAVILATLTTTASAGSVVRGCATRDMQILMLIEERTSASAFSSQQLTDAIHAMTHARMVCHEGRVVDALALYDTIADGLASDSVLSGRIR